MQTLDPCLNTVEVVPVRNQRARPFLNFAAWASTGVFIGVTLDSVIVAIGIGMAIGGLGLMIYQGR